MNLSRIESHVYTYTLHTYTFVKEKLVLRNIRKEHENHESLIEM